MTDILYDFICLKEISELREAQRRITEIQQENTSKVVIEKIIHMAKCNDFKVIEWQKLCYLIQILTLEVINEKANENF